jgi:hypothetical protein
MSEGKFQFSALGVFFLGNNLDRLEWAIQSITDPLQLASFIEPLRICEQARLFEDIGAEAKNWHNFLSDYGAQVVSQETKNSLRDCKTRWHALARERLQDLYLVTPACKTDPKHLMRGIQGMLAEENFHFLERVEVSDLDEACRCILIGSATAGEHIALRSAESLLRRWYEHKTGKELAERGWGKVLDKLAQEYPERERPKEIALLGYLKLRRDEVAHPDRVSNLTDAETTLMNVCILIAGIRLVLAELPLSSMPKSSWLDSEPPQ